jgi:hypothetical protein
VRLTSAETLAATRLVLTDATSIDEVKGFERSATREYAAAASYIGAGCTVGGQFRFRLNMAPRMFQLLQGTARRITTRYAMGYGVRRRRERCGYLARYCLSACDRRGLALRRSSRLRILPTASARRSAAAASAS